MPAKPVKCIGSNLLVARTTEFEFECIFGFKTEVIKGHSLSEPDSGWYCPSRVTVVLAGPANVN